jgi:hypothetical protein
VDKTPDISAGLKGRGLGMLNRNWVIIKLLQQAPPRPLVGRAPIKDISNQFQSLTGNMEKVLE